MEKFSSQPMELFDRIKSTTLKLYETPKTYPQMPVHQLQHFIAQAARTKKAVVLQYQSNDDKNISEVEGIIELVPNTGQIVVRSSHANVIHLIYPGALRHIRIA